MRDENSGDAQGPGRDGTGPVIPPPRTQQRPAPPVVAEPAPPAQPPRAPGPQTPEPQTQGPQTSGPRIPAPRTDAEPPPSSSGPRPSSAPRSGFATTNPANPDPVLAGGFPDASAPGASPDTSAPSIPAPRHPSAGAGPSAGPAPGASAPGTASAPAAPSPAGAGSGGNGRSTLFPGTDLTQLRFAGYNFGPQGEPAQLSIAATGDGSLLLRWEPVEHAAVYRVVASDEQPAPSPDIADVVAVTEESSAVDASVPRTAMRHFQVWRYDGASVPEVTSVQPVLHAQGRITLGVRNAHVGVDVAQVVGKWNVLPGIRRVHIYRARPAEAAHALGDPRFAVAASSPSLQGFQDAGTEPGERYVYQIVAEDTDGRTSDPHTVVLQIPVVLSPVTDLRFVLTPGETPTFDLEWTPPRYGRVEIFRSSRPPASGLGEEAMSAGRLGPGSGLEAEDMLPYPVEELEDGRRSMREVPWPHDWTRAYFTPVVYDGDSVFVGTTVHGQSVSPVREARLAERVGRKIVSFAWPRGADVVRLHRTNLGGTAESALQSPPVQEIDESVYRERGGMPIEGHEERAGATFYLVSGLFSGGELITSAPVRLDCPPLTQLRYEIDWDLEVGTPCGRVRVLAVQEDLHTQVAFVLVHNEGRMPLHKEDGHRVALFVPLPQGWQSLPRFQPGVVVGAQRWQEAPVVTFAAGVEGYPQQGFVRLFADLDPEAMRGVALLDPDVRVMRVDLALSHLAARLQQAQAAAEQAAAQAGPQGSQRAAPEAGSGQRRRWGFRRG
ncbi:hypothetical protein [Brevibacterium salitolerans]|uniref:Fibronectin type-III domain-containing protein n=1 Tax=Brevibacterium salitolerans TaxID=1403566 RepID=A0ABP5IPJ9_9MICO